MVNITVRVPTETDVINLAANLRPSDYFELKSVTDLTPLSAIRASLANSNADFKWAYLADGVLLCIAGCTRVGHPWLLATPLLDRHTVRLTKIAKQQVRMMLETYPMLSNMIDVRQTMTIRWLESLGFTLLETFELKPGYPVIRFQKAKNERIIKNTSRTARL